MRKSVKEIIATWSANSFGTNSEHRNWMLEASDEELHEYILHQTANETMRRMAISELAKRRFDKLKKPHWSLTWGFIVAFLAMVFAAIAAWPTIQSWFQSSSPAKKDSSSQPPQSHSAAAIQPTLNSAQSATNAAHSTNISGH